MASEDENVNRNEQRIENLYIQKVRKLYEIQEKLLYLHRQYCMRKNFHMQNGRCWNAYAKNDVDEEIKLILKRCRGLAYFNSQNV